MNVHLQTNTDDQSLGLLDLSRFADGPGYLAKLKVCSRGFMAERPFYFDDAALDAFLDAVRAMDRNLTGAAVLRSPYGEDDHVRLEVGPRGRVVVSGEVREHSEYNQVLRFGFETDQTVLAPFLRDLTAAVGHEKPTATARPSP